jgi:hypothetical protein
MEIITIKAPDGTADLIRRYGYQVKLELGGFFGIIFPVRFAGPVSDRSEDPDGVSA